MYRSAKAGQQVFYKNNQGDIIPVYFVGYYKERKTLVNPNMAVIRFEEASLNINVEIKDLFKADPYA
jgi:hypothetical protein